jgi:flagellar FliJ protein
MSKWAQSLIRLSGYEVETLQKRLAEISTRRSSAEMRLTLLEAEREGEQVRATGDADAAMQMTAYLAGWAHRRTGGLATLDEIVAEEDGARDALNRAFEEQKKFEHVAELSRLAAIAKQDKLEAAQLDDLALRRATR